MEEIDRRYRVLRAGARGLDLGCRPGSWLQYAARAASALFERALEIALATLAPGGHFVGKLFQGPAWQELVARARAHFESVRTVKPEGTRKESFEQYVVALGFRPPTG